MERNSKLIRYFLLVLPVFGITSCKIAELPVKSEDKSLPADFGMAGDSISTASVNWRTYFKDPYLVELIDTALRSNQELNMVLREIEISRNEIMARRGEYLPFGDIAFGTGVERSGRYTWNGVSEEDLKSRPDKFPGYVGDQALLGVFSWELDVWKKLHNARDAAVRRYLSGIEGKNFVVTNLVAEIANAYYELLVLDNQLGIVQQNIDLQQNALELVRVQKQSARVNELAVNRFEAQLINTRNLRYELQQIIVETENRINFLAGRYPQPVRRSKLDLNAIQLPALSTGVPAQLLANRADIRQAEQQLEANKLDIKVARANFYPGFTLRAGIGFQAFNPVYLINPKSIAFNVLGDMAAPLINRNAIKATYYNASERQIQSVYSYQQTLLNAFLEVMNQLSGQQNYTQSFDVKSKQVDILNRSVGISENLFNSARADYTEVLLTQREALEARMELAEIRKKQLNATINLYKALGGGWQ